jgi:hypothetical protein
MRTTHHCVPMLITVHHRASPCTTANHCMHHHTLLRIVAPHRTSPCISGYCQTPSLLRCMTLTCDTPSSVTVISKHQHISLL